MADIDRRKFLLGAAGLGSMLAPTLESLVAYAEASEPRTAYRPQAGPDEGGYGALVAAGPELELPVGFQYVVFGIEGSRMSDDNITPRAHDGMATFALPNGNIRLVRNHEARTRASMAALVGSSALAYDSTASGGTTSLEIAVRADGSRELVRDFVSLNGTIYNCAGGLTPWGTWLTCEESTEGPSHGFDLPHGYVFEVDAMSETQTPASPLPALGRFTHEAVAVDPWTGVVYLTEDRQTSGFYRLIPEHPGRLAEGGRLQMLAVDRRPHYLTPTGQTVGANLTVVWVDIDDPDPANAEANPLAVFAEGYGKGGALFSRLEGCWYGDESIYFDATEGGNAACGQIWQYRPVDDEQGILTLIYESPSPEILQNPDNLTLSPRGGLLICEDNAAPYVRGLTPDGRIFDFARNILNNREFAGACFAPDGETLFLNIQGDTAPGGPGNLGMTFAIWGPWTTGVL